MVSYNTSTRYGEPFIASNVRSYAYVTVSNLRYGVEGTHRGNGYCFGFVYGRHAVKIIEILKIIHDRADSELPALEEECALVAPLVPSNTQDLMPWAHRYVVSLVFSLY